MKIIGLDDDHWSGVSPSCQWRRAIMREWVDTVSHGADLLGSFCRVCIHLSVMSSYLLC